MQWYDSVPTLREEERYAGQFIPLKAAAVAGVLTLVSNSQLQAVQ